MRATCIYCNQEIEQSPGIYLDGPDPTRPEWHITNYRTMITCPQHPRYSDFCEKPFEVDLPYHEPFMPSIEESVAGLQSIIRELS